MSTTENEHDWFKQQVAACLAGALVGAELERFELHARGCEACASDLEAARKLEGEMATLFSNTIPADLVDLQLRRLRLTTQMRMPRVHPMVRKSAVAAAAAIVLGGSGYLASRRIESGGLSPKSLSLSMPRIGIEREINLGDAINERQATELRQNAVGSAATATVGLDRSTFNHHSTWTFTSASTSWSNASAWIGGIVAGEDSPSSATFSANIVASNGLPDNVNQNGSSQWTFNNNRADWTSNWTKNSNRSPNSGPSNASASNATFGSLGLIGGSGTVNLPSQVAVTNSGSQGFLDVNGNAQTIGGLNGVGSVTTFAGGGTLDSSRPTANIQVSPGTPSASAQSASAQTLNVNGGGAIIKAGRGELILRDPNSYAGGTNITAGTLAFAGDSLDRDLLIGARGGGGGGGGRGGMARGPYFRPADANSTALTSPNAVMPSEDGAEPRLQVADNGSLAIQGDLSKAKSLDAKEEQAGKDDKAQSAQPAAGNPVLAINQVDVPANSLPPTTQPIIQATIRKVIREGVMEFEVDSFDSAFSTITKVTAEESGFVAAADSDKLPNGKVRGTITVRVPPDNLDRLVLKLRSLGELKSQRLGSRDVGKEYTDLESELRAARAMEERLIGMIKSAQGKVADLLAAEKELGTWRTKIEKIQGELNYYNNLVSMATLSITAYEKDIRTPASASQTEEINAGVETDDVEASRAAAIKSIDDAKGRIVESSLQKMEAGKFAARIVAEIPAENAGPLVDRLKQLGRVARLDIQRKQTPDNPKSPGVAPLKVEQTPTRLILSLVSTPSAARQSEEINAGIETDDVEASRNAALKSIDDAKGRIVDSTLQKLEAGQFAAQIIAEVPQENAGQLVDRLRQLGRVARLDIQRKQTDAGKPQADATPLKIDQGPTRFVVSMYNLANVAPRLTTNLNLAGDDVEKIYRAILKRVGDAQGRVVTSNLNHQDATQVVGSIQFDVKAADADAVLNDIRKDVQVLRMSVNENPDTANVTTAKQAFTVQIIPTSLVSPREMRTLAVQTDQVEAAMQSVSSAVNAAGGKMVESSMTQEADGRSSARIGIELPLAKADQLVEAIRKLGQVRTAEASKNSLVPEGSMARARINVMIGSAQSIVSGGHGLWDSIRNGLSTSVQGLLWSLELIVIGLCLIGPWLVMVWGGWKLARRRKVTAP